MPLLCIALASSTSGWGASASSGAARASDADGGPALVLQKHPYTQARASILELSVAPNFCPWYLSGVGVRRSLAGQDWRVRLGHGVFAIGTQKRVGML